MISRDKGRRLSHHDWLSQQVFIELARSSYCRFFTRFVVLFLTFLALKMLITHIGSLSLESYSNGVLALELIRKIGVFGGTALIALVVLLARYGLFQEWTQVEQHGTVRAFITFVAGLVAWPLVTLGHNYFFDQGYYLDRVLLCLMLLLLWWRPVFILPFILLAFALLWQTMQPSLGSGSYIPHKRQLLLVLILFGASILIPVRGKKRQMDTFWFLTCCLTAAVYWEPGLGKLQISWLNHQYLYHMPLLAYANGWLSFLDSNVLVHYAEQLAPFDMAMRIFVVTIEIGCLFFLARRWTSVTLLCCVVVFHLGVFALYGYLFWTWIGLDLALLVVLLRDTSRQFIPIYSLPHLGLSIVLIGFAGYWCEPSRLAWLDSRVSYTFHYVGIGKSGVRYTVPTEFFAPYEDAFTMGNFSYLVDEHRALSGPYGVTDWVRDDAIKGATSAEEVFSAEKRAGRDRYDPRREETFYDFLRTYLVNHNRSPPEGSAWDRFAPPRQFINFPTGNVYVGQEPLQQILVKEVTTFYDGTDLTVIREIPLARIPIVES